MGRRCETSVDIRSTWAESPEAPENLAGHTRHLPTPQVTEWSMAEECGGVPALRPLLIITLHSTFAGQVTDAPHYHAWNPFAACCCQQTAEQRGRTGVLHAIPRSSVTANILFGCTSSPVRHYQQNRRGGCVAKDRWNKSNKALWWCWGFVSLQLRFDRQVACRRRSSNMLQPQLTNYCPEQIFLTVNKKTNIHIARIVGAFLIAPQGQIKFSDSERKRILSSVTVRISGKDVPDQMVVAKKRIGKWVSCLMVWVCK